MEARGARKITVGWIEQNQVRQRDLEKIMAAE